MWRLYFAEARYELVRQVQEQQACQDLNLQRMEHTGSRAFSQIPFPQSKPESQDVQVYPLTKPGIQRNAQFNLAQTQL